MIWLEAHWATQAKHLPSPNFNERPAGACPELIVIHNISLPPNVFGNSFIEQFFCNGLPVDAHPYFKQIEGMKVSSHFLIKRDGAITQFVGCDKRAWHAGESQWRGRNNCNDFSIGIEMEGTDDTPYENRQYQQLVGLIRALWSAYPTILPDAITGHEHIAPGRKTDPGPAFDWDWLKSILQQGEKA